MVDDLHTDLGQALLVTDIEGTGPSRVLAHDRGRLHLHQIDQHVFRGIADRLRQGRRGEVPVEGVLVARVVLVDREVDLVGGGTGRDHRRLEPRRPGHQCQHHLGDVAGDDEVDLVLGDRPLEGPDRVGGGGLVVVTDDLDLAPVDPAVGVDLVGGELDGLRDRGADDRLRLLGDDPDPDRVGGACLRRPQAALRPLRAGPGHDSNAAFHRHGLLLRPVRLLAPHRIRGRIVLYSGA